MGDTTTRTGRTIEIGPPTWSAIFGTLLAAHGNMWHKRADHDCEPDTDGEWCYRHDADIEERDLHGLGVAYCNDTTSRSRTRKASSPPCEIASSGDRWRAWKDKLNGDYFANIENFRDMARAADLWNEHIKAEKGD
jgi:hypothetical protein